MDYSQQTNTPTKSPTQIRGKQQPHSNKTQAHGTKIVCNTQTPAGVSREGPALLA